MAGTSLTYDQWNSKFGAFSGQFPELHKNTSHADVIFLIGRNQIKVHGHKFVLSASSWEFYNVFYHIKLDKDELPIEDATHEAFLCFLEFSYNGQVNCCDPKELLCVFKLARRFRVKELIKMCETQMKNILRERLNRDTCLEMYQAMKENWENSHLLQDVLEMIGQHIIYLADDLYTSFVHFLTLPRAKVRGIAKLEKLHCDEMQLFEILMRWAKYNCKDASRDSKSLRKTLEDIFYEIRFPIMRTEWILQIQADYPNLLSAQEYSNIAKFITGKEQTCPGFRCKFRKCGSAQGYVSMRDLSDFVPFVLCRGRTRVVCFRNKPERTNTFSHTFSIDFKCDTTLKLIGFGFYTKVKKGSSCCSTLKRKSLPYVKNLAINYSQSHRWWACSEYEYGEYSFVKHEEIVSNEWYTLQCKFDEKLPVVKTFDTPFVFYDEKYKVDIGKEHRELIPSLIFE